MAPATHGMIWIASTVRAKPIPSCSVTAVPTKRGSASSVTAAENWALSATIVTPQTSATSAKSQPGPSKAKPITSAEAPESPIISAVVAQRPIRSDSAPARTQPKPPDATTRKVSIDAEPVGNGNNSVSAAVAKARNHAHMA